MKAALHYERRRCVWNVEYGGEQIVTASADPEYDACRVLADCGFTGAIEFVDGSTGRPRIRFPSIEAAAKFRMAEYDRGLRLTKRREGPRASPKTALIDLAGTRHRPTPKTAFSVDTAGRPA